jgi:predicted acylesterase/phospholipase RssA
VLVDGGLVDNLPIDVMSARTRGPIIAVNVFPFDQSTSATYGPLKGLNGFLRRVGALSKGRPLLFETLTRSTVVGSRNATEKALSSRPPALHLVPDLSKFGMLDWRAFEGLFEAGYTCARRELDAGALPRTLWEGQIEDSAG